MDILNAYNICNTQKNILSVQNSERRFLGVSCPSVVVSVLTVFQTALLGDADCSVCKTHFAVLKNCLSKRCCTESGEFIPWMAELVISFLFPVLTVLGLRS